MAKIFYSIDFLVLSYDHLSLRWDYNHITYPNNALFLFVARTEIVRLSHEVNNDRRYNTLMLR